MKARPGASATLTLLATLALTTATAAGAATAVTGTLLPVPNQPNVRAVDVNELGVIVGNAGPGDTSTAGVTGHRWAYVKDRFLRQQLASPSGSNGVNITGVNRFGEPAGTAGTGEDYSSFRAVRWPVTGFKPVYLAEANSRVSAVGDNTWGVAQPINDSISGTAEIVARDGTSTPANDLGGRINTVDQIGGPNTALVSSISGAGQGSSGSAAVYQSGAVKRLPVTASFFFGGVCTSTMRADGTVAYSGTEITNQEGQISFRSHLAIHRGGAPGAEEELSTGDRTGFLGCSGSDTLASDDTVAGYLTSNGTLPEEAAVWRGGVKTDLGVPAGFTRSRAVAAATGGRVVVVATDDNDDYRQAAFLYRNGVTTPLTVPSGWSLSNIVELTDRGLVVGNVQNADGKVRPIAWRT
jgi:hypothetical protein